jgi:hypothetical protein
MGIPVDQAKTDGAQAEGIALCVFDARTGSPSAPQPAALVSIGPRHVELLTHANAWPGQRCALLFAGPHGEGHRITGRIVQRELSPDRRTLLRLDMDAPLSAALARPPGAENSAAPSPASPQRGLPGTDR